MVEGILIADDNAAARQAVRGYLEAKGFYVCGEAVDGRDAVEKAKELKPALILLDLAMPEMNGIQVATSVREHLLDVRIILFTMYGELTDRRWLASDAGIDAVLSKPDGVKNLESCVRRLLARK